MPAGRPTDYDPSIIEQCKILIRLGAIDKDLAEFFDVHIDTIYEWKKVHPEFSDALKEAKTEADSKVEESLFKRASGYSHEAVKIFCHEGKVIEAPYTEHYPPDATSMIFWLKNRQPARWRDKQELEHSGDLTFTVNLTPRKDGT